VSQLLGTEPKIIITDTSVLINFLRIDRADLLNQYPGKFLITDHVISEVTIHYPSQHKKFHDLIAAGLFELTTVDHPEELRLYTTLRKSGRLGSGECSAIACAIHRGYLLAMDDKLARKQAEKFCSTLNLLSTTDIILNLILHGSLSTLEADAIKENWQNRHRFTIKLKSFEDMMLNQQRLFRAASGG